MEFLLAAFVLAALIWSVPLIHAQRLFRLAVGVLVVGTIAGPNLLSIDLVIQLSADRVLWVALMMFVLVQWRLGHVSMPRLTRIDWIVLAFVGYLALNAVMAGGGPYRMIALSRCLFYVMMPAGLYFVARVVDLTDKDVQWFLGCTTIVGLYLAVTAFFESRGMYQLVFPKYISSPKVAEFFGRGRGPLLNPIANGMVMNFGVIACTLGALKGDRYIKILSLVIGAVLGIGVVCTLTRSVLLGSVVSSGLIVLILSPRWLRVLGLATVVMFAGAMLGGFKDQLMSYKRDKNLSAAEAAESVSLRPLLAIVAWEMFKDKPVTGHGYGHYDENKKGYHNIRAYGMPLSKVRSYVQHNVFLAILVDTGLVGLSLMLSVLGIIGAMGWKLASDEENSLAVRQVGMIALGTLGMYFVNGMFHDTMIMPMIHMYLFLTLGVAVTAYERGLVIATEDSRSQTENYIPKAAPNLAASP